MNNLYDLIIIGGGPAAINAAIYAARKKVKTLLIAKSWGGQMRWTNLIENYLGCDSVTGPELIKKFVHHLETVKKYGLEVKEGEEATEVQMKKDRVIEVKTDKGVYPAKALIVATGRRAKKLGVPGEETFTGKGISHCPTCDAPFFKNKAVAVIGGGNAGLEAALDMTKYASRIYLLEFKPHLMGDECFRERINQYSQIEVITNAEVKEIKGGQFVRGLVYQKRDSGEIKEIAVEGVFIEIGSIPNSHLVANVVELNKEGEIKIDSRNRTSEPNIFAAGDVTDISHKQIIIAAGEGAKAVLNAYEYLQNSNQ